MKSYKVKAIVLAAGSGRRMQSDVPKQFMYINGREVLYYSLKTFQNNESISGIILVTDGAHIQYCRDKFISEYGFDKIEAVIEGGGERYDSVYNGLKAADCDVVMIHDGARPFVTDSMIEMSLTSMREGEKACTVAVPVKDTIKTVSVNGEKIYGAMTPDRKYLYAIQTPQTFVRDELMVAYDKLMADENHNITDDTSVMEQYGGAVSKIIPGAYENIKITTPEDLEIAEIFCKKIL